MNRKKLLEGNMWGASPQPEGKPALPFDFGEGSEGGPLAAYFGIK